MESPIVPEDKLQIVDPLSIIVKDEMPRLRKDLGKINDLAMSIKKFGQLQPCVVNRNMELVAGGRRLAACVIAGVQVKICFVDEVDPLRLREMELEENIQRKALTPAEEVLAVAELHKLKTDIYGKGVSGVVGGKEGTWTQQDTADVLGKSRASVVEDLMLAEAIKNFPSLAVAKKKAEIKKAVKGLETVARNIDALSKYEETIKRTDKFIILNKDSREHFVSLPNEGIDLIITDPPYGIDIFEQGQGLGGETGGGNTTAGFKYEDSEDYAKAVLSAFAQHSYRITKHNAHLYCFCAPSHFWWLKEELATYGWLVRERPIIWIKRETGQNNYPSYWPSSTYEMILFARKVESRLVIEGRGDWIQCDPVSPNERLHNAEKPVPLLKELISRTCLPGSYIYDPFAGSGAVVQAGLELKMLPIACELLTEAYANMLARITHFLEKQ